MNFAEIKIKSVTIITHLQSTSQGNRNRIIVLTNTTNMMMKYGLWSVLVLI